MSNGKLIKFELNKAGVRDLMKSAEMKELMLGMASRIRNNAGEGYEVAKHSYPERNGVSIYPATIHAYHSNMKHNTLLKAAGLK